MLSNQIQQTIIMDSSNFTHLKPDIEKDKVLGFIPSEISVRQSRAMCVTDDDDNKDEVTVDKIDQEDNKEMVKQVVSEGFQVNPVITTNDDPSSVLMVELNQKEVSEEPISQLQNRVKKNQECEEPMGKGSIEFYDSFIAEEKKEDQFEISSKDSAKEEVCQAHSLTPSISQYENVVVKMMNSESSSRIEGKQDEVLQVQDVITGDQHVILVVETKSMSPSQNLVERSNWDLYSDKKRTISHEMMIGSDEINWGKWGESSASGNTSSNGMAKIENTHIVNGNGCAREGMLGSIALGKRSSGICSENIRQQVKKGSRRNFTETNLKKDELSMFVEATNVFCQKKSDGSKRSYSREEMEELRFVNSYQQRQIWRKIYTGLGPIVAKQLNQLAEARQNGNAITNQQQQQHHHQHPRQCQQHHHYSQQSQQHHHYSQKSQQHHQYSQQHHHHPKKPLQHQHHHHQHQQVGVHKENASILGAATTMLRPIHLRMDTKNAQRNCYVPYVQYIPVYYSISH